jgi:hypothetical protein
MKRLQVTVRGVPAGQVVGLRDLRLSRTAAFEATNLSRQVRSGDGEDLRAASSGAVLTWSSHRQLFQVIMCENEIIVLL